MTASVLGPALALLPVLSAVVLGVVALTRRGREGDPLAGRQAALDAAVAAGLFVVLSGELLGAARSLARGPIAVAWAVLLAAALIRIRLARPPVSSPALPAGRSRWLWAGSAGILAVTFLIALAAPPNTWDSMTYHMSRVAHWLQDRTLAFFPTHSLRELYMAPWVELAIAQLHALWGGDRLANLVQWTCQAGSLAGVSLVAARLGAGPAGQAFAALFAATIPMAVLQASSTQTDAAAAFWLVALVAHALRAVETRAGADVLLAGGALGLAILTKPTAYFYGAPLVVWLAIRAVRATGLRLAPAAAGAAVLALLVNAPFYARSNALWGSPLGPAGAALPGAPTRRGQPPRVPAREWLVARAFKNLALHLGTPLRPLDAAVERSVRAADAWSKTWQDVVPPAYRIEASPHEDRAASPLHLLLLAGLLAGVRDRRATLGLCASLLAGFLILVSQVPWQPFNARLHLPLLVLAAPVAGLLVERVRRPALAPVAGVVLFAGAIPWLVRGLPRRLVGTGNVLTTSRDRQYFLNDPAREARLRDEARRISDLGCRSVGLVGGDDTWEYPLWVLAREASPDVTFRHVRVANLSGALPPETAVGPVDCVCDLEAGGCARAPAAP